jgi:hypothetical protein
MIEKQKRLSLVKERPLGSIKLLPIFKMFFRKMSNPVSNDSFNTGMRKSGSNENFN